MTLAAALLPSPVALLYGLCGLLLAGLALFVAAGRRGRHRRRSRRLRRAFALLTLSLLAWQATLFLEVRAASPVLQLWLGRANFAAVSLAAYLALRFVQELAAAVGTEGSGGGGEAAAGEQGSGARPPPPRPASSAPLAAATGLLALLALLTPLVSARERVESAGTSGAHAVTDFGPLFPLYLLHVLGCLGAAVALALGEGRRARDPARRRQFLLVGAGAALTGAVGAVTNALLPYAFGDFRFGDVGTLSVLLFALAVAWATFVHGLFDARALVRETLVCGVLLAFVLGAYGSAVFVATQYLTEGEGGGGRVRASDRLVQFAVLAIAFSFDPLRRFLEEKTDRLLFGRGGRDGEDRDGGTGREGEPRATRGGRHAKGRRAGRRVSVFFYLFPWRRS